MKATNPANAIRPSTIIVWLALAACVVASFAGLARYYFAQDDFQLIAAAIDADEGVIGKHFSRDATQFRPLTKVLYFRIMHGMFGMNPVPYHVVSILAHLLTAFLVYWLLRRLRVGEAAALVVCAVFALNAGFTNVVGWISAIQPLFATLFFLAAANFAIRAVDTGSRGDMALAMAGYVLALLSAEQAWGLGVVVWVYAALKHAGAARARLARGFRDAAPLLAITGLYALFRIAWKGLPDEGPYLTAIGYNVIENLLTYLEWVYDFSAIMSFEMASERNWFGAAHVLILLLIIYNIARGRRDMVLLGATFYVAGISPALFLVDHTFYMHNYLPAFGMLYMLCQPVEDLFAMLNRWRQGVAAYAPLIVTLVLGGVCFTHVRANERMPLAGRPEMRQNFVFRRAVIAETMRTDIVARVPDAGALSSIHLVYIGPPGWYESNVRAAIGFGTAIPLALNQPDLRVEFHRPGGTIEDYRPTHDRVIFYNELGNCFTENEVEDVGVSVEPK